ncbi:hypothetical protein Tco_0541123 [Tanacetum coccineum]
MLRPIGFKLIGGLRDGEGLRREGVFMKKVVFEEKGVSAEKVAFDRKEVSTEKFFSIVLAWCLFFVSLVSFILPRFVTLFFLLSLFSSLFAMPKRGIKYITCTVTREEYAEFLDRFMIPSSYGSILPCPNQTTSDVPPGYAVLYLSHFLLGNFWLPLNTFLLDVLEFFCCHIYFLNPFRDMCLSSFVVACRAYGGEPTLSLFRSLFTLAPVGDWVNFQKHPGDSIPSIFAPSMLHISDWKSKFIFVCVDLFADQNPSLVTLYKHSLGSFSFPFPSEPFDMTLRSRLMCYPFQPRVFSKAILYLVVLTPLWEKSPLHLVIYVGGQVVFSAVHANVALSKGSPEMTIPGVLERNVGIGDVEGVSAAHLLKAKRCGLGSLLAGDSEAQESHALLSSFDHPEYQKRLGSLSLVELPNFHDILRLHDKVFKLYVGQSGSAAVISFLEAEKEKLKEDTASLRELSSLVDSSNLTSLNKLDLATEDHAFMVIDLFPHATCEEITGMDLGLHPKDVKAYEPNVVEVFEKAIDDFYHVEFPYLDLLAYHSNRSLGLLKSFEPPSLPLWKTSSVGPSSNPFI